MGLYTLWQTRFSGASDLSNLGAILTHVCFDKGTVVTLHQQASNSALQSQRCLCMSKNLAQTRPLQLFRVQICIGLRCSRKRCEKLRHFALSIAGIDSAGLSLSSLTRPRRFRASMLEIQAITFRAKTVPGVFEPNWQPSWLKNLVFISCPFFSMTQHISWILQCYSLGRALVCPCASKDETISSH